VRPAISAKVLKRRLKMTKIFKNKKELLFLEPIKPEMTVDDIFNRLMKIFKEKGIKVYPDTLPGKGAE
jgi:hypothetical protein